MEKEIREILLRLYGADHIYGPYSDDVGRRRCVVSINGKTSSRQYAKLLMEAKLGRLLTADEEVDHIDEDATNDDMGNLQVLTKAQHREKSAKAHSKRQSQRVLITCPGCGGEFECRRYRLKLYAAPCCSRKCSGKLNWRNQYACAA